MEEVTQASDGPAAPIAYASFTARVGALVTDFLVMTGALVLILLGGTVLEAVPGSGRIEAMLLWALILLYEPLQVWSRGATVGHRRRNLQVVATNGEPLGLIRSFTRFAIKALFGIVSFVPMFFTRRHQALQDVITRTHVIVRDPLNAPSYHVALEREPDWQSGLPSRGRRVAITVVYLLLLFVVWLVVLGSISEQCANSGVCTRGEAAVLQLSTWCWLAGCLAVALAGWRGMLPGARRGSAAFGPRAQVT